MLTRSMKKSKKLNDYKKLADVLNNTTWPSYMALANAHDLPNGKNDKKRTLSQLSYYMEITCVGNSLSIKAKG